MRGIILAAGLGILALSFADGYSQVFSPTTLYILDYHAFSFVRVSQNQREFSRIAVVIIDDWSDGHGQTSQAIIQYGASGVHSIALDYVARSKNKYCDDLPPYALHHCYQDSIVELLETVNDVAKTFDFVVVNMSLSFFEIQQHGLWKILAPKGCESYPTLTKSVLHTKAIIAEAPDNVFFVAAAGNEGSRERIGFPACLGRVYSASALRQDEQYSLDNIELAYYSNYAPGRNSFALPLGGRMWGWLEGTSFSTPLLTALLVNALAECRAIPNLKPVARTTDHFHADVLTFDGVTCQK